MGLFSWTCAHCKHSILSAADPGINDWMRNAVVLDKGGSRVLGLYGGYGDLDGLEISDKMYDGAIMAHQACWEVAGKPEFEFYERNGLSSPSARDQGYFFKDEHDMIDPRVPDPVERECLLGAGRELREKRRYDDRAEKVGEIAEAALHLPPQDRWKARFSVWAPSGGLTTYALCDKIPGNDLAAHEIQTEDEIVEIARRLWGEWVESSEFAKLKARAVEMGAC